MWVAAFAPCLPQYQHSFWSLPIFPAPQDESWDEPSTGFELFVGEVVRARIGKYVQPGHPAKLDMQEAMQVGASMAQVAGIWARCMGGWQADGDGSGCWGVSRREGLRLAVARCAAPCYAVPVPDLPLCVP